VSITTFHWVVNGQINRGFLDWAYVEDWCRRLTGTFSDVYVFTVPLYLPKLDADGKWRVVGPSSILLLQFL
jgi:DNA/RNA endonuclease G (NUC1)